MKKTKTPLLQLLQKSFMQANEIQNPSRRKFIKQTLLGSGALLVGASMLESFAADNKKVVILGAGIAGLHSAFLLKQQNVGFKIYEASNRAGGRMYSATNLMGEGITTELGAEFIDTDHEDILSLAKQFNLPLIDTEQDIPLQKYVYYFEGKKYKEDDVKNALLPFANSILNDIETLPDLMRYDSFGSIKKWDDMSIIDYLKEKGMDGWLLSLFDVAFTTEYGLDAKEQSAINMLFLLDPSMPNHNLFGTSDERYKIKGGNQRICDELAQRIGNIHFDYEVKIIEDYKNGYRVHFANGEKAEADYIICTIPFSILRNITLDLKEMTAVKKKSIQELGYGRNAKTFAGYNKNIWRKNGYSGEVFTDKNFQLGWDHSQMQGTRTCAYTFYTGGSESDAMKDMHLHQKIEKYATQLDQVFTGSKNELNGKQSQFYWPEFKHTKGSYACYKVGQWTTIAGAEQEPIGNIFFAGEHCSYSFQGFMNGGAETGRAAAINLLESIISK